MARLRFFRRLIAMAAVLLVALVLHGAWRLVRARSPWPRWLLGTIGHIAGARVTVRGTPVRRDAVILANHQSWPDILVLAGVSGCAFVAKAELRAVPLVGWLCTLNETLFVSRADRMGIAAQVAQLRTALGGGRPVAIFPEGTTGNGRALLPFKGALLAVLDPPPPGLQVQPVAISYGAATDMVAWVGNEPGGQHARRLLEQRGGFPVTVTFCEPFDPQECAGRKAIAAESHARIAAALFPSLSPASENR